MLKKIEGALISVFDKKGLNKIVKKLNELGVTLYSTGGTQSYIESLGISCIPVERITDYPSILGGRVKTLHPKIFGGILSRASNEQDQKEVQSYDIPKIDLVIVDLYPFEDTVAQNPLETEAIEKIDIGGVSLIRATAKNFHDTICIASKEDYELFYSLLENKKGTSSLQNRKYFATKAFHISAHYDTQIFNYFNKTEQLPYFKESIISSSELRYGENPHQTGCYHGPLSDMLQQLNGKTPSYNNLLDVDAAIHLIHEFRDDNPTFAILKHNNACGIATCKTPLEAYTQALSCDPISAFGGIIIANSKIDKATAEEIKKLFCEIVIAPNYDEEALHILNTKQKLIVLKLNQNYQLPKKTFRTILNGILAQDRDLNTDSIEDLTYPTAERPDENTLSDLIFASKICKHTRSNAIVLAKNKKLLALGVGQTSRLDALKQAIQKAKDFGFSLENCVMASDAFFPFPDCVEIGHKSGVTAIIQPGGSIKDQESINYCNQNNLSMVFTGTRHFKH